MKKMNKYLLLLLALVGITIVGCQSSSNGELTGVLNRPAWVEPEPTGMSFIPQGYFNMGPNEQDVPFAMNAQPKTVSIDAFWMDETEISNNEYRQFVFWVRDSIEMRLLVMNSSQADLFQVQPENPDAIDQLFYDPSIPSQVHLNWKNRKLLKTPEVQKDEALKNLYFDVHNSMNSLKELNTHMLVFEYYYVDYREAALKKNRFVYTDLGDKAELPTGEYQGTFENRNEIVKYIKTPIYPDTLSWIADFTYSYNEPYARQYFWHPAYDDYPVVGVNWKQAVAFSAWRTKIQNENNVSQGTSAFEDYRLPTEAEWEYAARGGKDQTIYPWGGPYARNYKGCILANFKPMRGMYAIDGATRTARVDSYYPNDYGLYNMAGNVAEWTSSQYDDASYNFVHDLNPDYQVNVDEDLPFTSKRKVVRGGSWKDIALYLQCGVRSYEYLDTAKCYIGFRNVRTYLGREFEGF